MMVKTGDAGIRNKRPADMSTFAPTAIAITPAESPRLLGEFSRHNNRTDEVRLSVTLPSPANGFLSYAVNALGGIIGGAVVDSAFGASTIPFAAAVLPLVALLFILSQERRSAGPVRSRVDRADSLKSLGEEQLSPSSC